MSDAVAKMKAALPKGDGNGLQAIAAEMVANPDDVRVGLILFDAEDVTRKTDDGQLIAKVRIRRVEVIRDVDDADVMRRILMRAFERRTGQETLPFDLEQDVESAFEGFEPEEPEGGEEAGGQQTIT